MKRVESEGTHCFVTVVSRLKAEETYKSIGLVARCGCGDWFGCFVGSPRREYRYFGFVVAVAVGEMMEKVVRPDLGNRW